MLFSISNFLILKNVDICYPSFLFECTGCAEDQSQRNSEQNSKNAVQSNFEPRTCQFSY